MDLRLGRWQDVLGDVGCDAVICDPPYGEKTHGGNQNMEARFNGAAKRDLSYSHWTGTDVADFVGSWAPRCSGWIAAMTSDDLCAAWRASYEAAGLYAFAPVPVIQPRVRLVGDGPASCAVYLCVGRPRSRAFASWGALPGWYYETQRAVHIGGKPLNLMRAIVRDYSRPGDLVCDPCAGAGTTLRAALLEGRRAVGAECDPETWRIAMGQGAPKQIGQMSLLDEGAA